MKETHRSSNPVFHVRMEVGLAENRPPMSLKLATVAEERIEERTVR